MRSLILAVQLLVVTSMTLPAIGQGLYEGKTVNLVINYPAGGSSDIEGRIIARFLGRHIPGKPTVIVRNMPGAGGLTATNHMGLVTPDDITQLAFFTWNPIHQLLGSEGLRVKYDQFHMVAGFQQPVVVYIRKDVAPGIDKPKDIVKAKGFFAAGFNPLSHGYLRQLLALDILGVKYKGIASYAGNKDVELAILKNEVQLSNNSLPGYQQSVMPSLLKPGIVTPLFQFDTQGEDGKFQGSAALPDIPTFLAVYRELHGSGAMPQGVEWDTLVLISNLMDSMYRAIFLPPKVPDQAVAMMRAALDALCKDEEFLAAYRSTIGSDPMLLSGSGAEKIVTQLRDVKPELTDFLKSYVAKDK